MANCAEYARTDCASRRRLLTKVAHGERPSLTAFDRARIEALIKNLIALLDAHDAPMADMEPDHDGELEAEEASEQPVRHPTVSKVIRFPRLRRPRIDWSTPAQQEAAELAALPVVSHRRGSKLCTVIEGEVVR